jgi:hypothetical protein
MPSYGDTWLVRTPSAPPTANAGGPYQGDEGAAIAMSGASAPAGALVSWRVDSWLCSFDDASLLKPNLTCTDNGNFVATLTVSDGVTPAVTSNAYVTVNNVAPTIAISGANNVNEGSPYSLTLGAVTDPGTDTVSAYIVYWGDGNGDRYDRYPSNDVQTHTYADGPNNYNITVDLTDEDGTFLDRANALSVTVDNVAPTITGISADALTLIGTQVTFTGYATDPSAPDTTAGFEWQWSVDGGAYTAFGAPGATFSTSFLTCGVHTVTARARDKDLGVSDPSTPDSVSAYEAHFLHPLDEGVYNLVRAGKTVQVKMSIDCDGVPLTGLAPVIQLLSGDRPVSTDIMSPGNSTYSYHLQVPSTASAGDLFTVQVQPFGTGADLRIILQIRK